MSKRSNVVETEEALLEAVFFHPEAATTSAAAADMAKIARGTAARHWTNLLREGALRQRYEVSRARKPLRTRSIISIETEQSAFVDGKYETQEELAKYLKEDLISKEGAEMDRSVLVKDAWVVIGNFGNLAIMVLAKDEDTTLRFVTNILARLPGIRNTVIVRLVEV